MARRVIREDTVSHERWMVSYADFLTLLLAFFIVMYSVSHRDESKFRVLSQTMTKAFNIPPTSIVPIQVGEPVAAVMPGVVSDATQAPEQQPESGRSEEQGPRATTSEPQLPEEFRRISQRVEEEFAGLVASGRRKSTPWAAASSSLATMPAAFSAMSVSRRAAWVAMLT